MSADTIVPGYTDPQDLNRYSYVDNDPLRYTDPTGHMRVEDGPQSKGCSNPKYCQSGKPKPANELAKLRKDKNENKGGDGKSLARASKDVVQSGPQGCEVLDCVLSAVSFGASVATFGTPPIDAIAFGIDVVATGWSTLRTEDDFAQGKISNTRRLWLNATAAAGVLPAMIHPALGAIGAGASLLNLFITTTGIPN